MLLRASGEMTGLAIDPTAIVDAGAAAASGIPHAPVLVQFAEATVGADDGALAAARDAVLSELGSEALVDAAAVASNFERMVRIADGTGIPLDPPMAALGADLRSDLGLERFASAARTPAVGLVGRALGAAARPTLRMVLRVVGRLRGVRTESS
jgi:hypothetical protein